MSDPCHLCRKGRIRITHHANVYSCDACRVGFGKPDGAPNKIGCLVPFCRSTRGDRKGGPVTEGMEWICSRHWGAVPKRDRRRLSRAYRWYAKRFGDNAFWTYPPGSPNRLSALRYHKHWERCWERCKAAACDRAGGIG